MNTMNTMKSTQSLILTATTLLAASLPSAFGAGTYDLTSQFSSSSNPNGVWSYDLSNVPITQPVDFWWGTGWCNYPLSGDASITKAKEWGGAHDWQVGDIVMHAPSQTIGGPTVFLDIKWTSPASGVISISGRAWDANFAAGRDANWWLSVGGTTIASRGSVFGLYRSDSAAQFSSNLMPGGSLTGINVTAGEVVEFGVATDTLYGHFVGVEESITLTQPVPEPSTYLAGLSALGMLGLFGWRNRK